MENLVLLLEFFGGIILVFALAWLVGHLFKLDKFFEKFENNRHISNK